MFNLYPSLRRCAVLIFVAASVLMYCNTSIAAGLLIPSNSQSPLQIREHHVRVVIEDGYAVTEVEQVFHNADTVDVEAVYSFPVPERASVGEFTYWIDGQPVTAEVMRKEQARQVYQQEKQAGREAALTEKDDYRTFDFTVYPVRAHQDVRTRLVYIQPAHVDTSVGRYVYPLEDGGVDTERLAFWSYENVVRERFSFDLQFRSSVPVDGLRLPRHPQATITQVDDQQWQVSMTNGVAEEHESGTTSNSPFSLDTDIVVYWRHKQGQPGAVNLITHREADDKRGTFMMTFTPGDDLAAITEGRDWVFVLDFSGSMKGKYQTLLEGVRAGLQKLPPQDRFRVVLFNSSAREITNGYLPADAQHVSQTITTLENLQPTDGTNLYAGLHKGLKQLDDDRSSALVLVTDGVANVGRTEKQDFLELLRNYDVRLFTFVMGNSANRPLLQGLAKASNGFAANVSNSDDVTGKLLEATSRMTHEALHDVEVEIHGIKVADFTPETIGSLYRGQQLIVMGHYWGDGEANVTLRGKVSGKQREYTSRFDFPRSSGLHPELERMWAFAAIEDLQDQARLLGEDADTRQAITDIALKHGLVTNHTSLIVVREERFNELGVSRDNKQRVEKERQAREQRATQQVRNNRVDNSQPMFQNNAPSHGSGGSAIGAVGLLMLIACATWRRTRRVNEI